MDDNRDEALARKWDDRKSEIMVDLLGEMHDIVMHALIPYAIGGGLDLYYYPNGIKGTAIATKELCELPGQGSSNRLFESYELVMFTRCELDLEKAKDESSGFGKAHRSINAVLNHIAPYSANATLNPFETCEFPEDMESVGGKCMIFDAYGIEHEFLEEGHREEFGLLAVIEVFPCEMEYARLCGGAKLIDKLKFAGVYPYSDLDRPVVAKF